MQQLSFGVFLGAPYLLTVYDNWIESLLPSHVPNKKHPMVSKSRNPEKFYKEKNSYY